MKAVEVREKTTQVLNEELNGLYEAQFGLRMQGRSGQSFKYDQLKKNRRDIARIRTVLNERKRAEQDS